MRRVSEIQYVEPTGFADGLNGSYKRMKEIKDDTRVFSLSKWKYGVAIY
jgi:hypothetical protein